MIPDQITLAFQIDNTFWPSKPIIQIGIFQSQFCQRKKKNRTLPGCSRESHVLHHVISDLPFWDCSEMSAWKKLDLYLRS